MLPLQKYLQTAHNDPAHSDFRMIAFDENGTKQTLYLHKIILMSRPFFNTFFETTMGNPDKSVMEVDDIEIAKHLTKYIYAIPNSTIPESIEDIIEYTHQALEWQMFDYRDTMMVNLYRRLGKTIPLHLMNPLYLLFGNCGDIPVNFGSHKWTGKHMISTLVNTLIQQKIEITSDMLDSDLMRYLDDDSFTEICVRLNAFDKLLSTETYTDIIQPLDPLAVMNKRKRGLQYFRKHFDSLYKVTSRYFTPKQISLIRQAHHINQPGTYLGEGNNLIVESFRPFRVRYYTLIGRLQYSENLVEQGDVMGFDCSNSIHFKMDISVKDFLYIEGTADKIMSMELPELNEKVTEGYCGNTYNIVLQSPLESTPKVFTTLPLVFKFHDYIGSDPRNDLVLKE